MCHCTQILRWDLGIKLRSQCLENKQGWSSPQLPEHVLLSQEHACFVHVGLPQCPCFCSFSLPSHLAVYFEGTLDPCFPCCGVHQGVWLSGCRQDKKWSCGHLGLEDKEQPGGTNHSYEGGGSVGEQGL